MQLVHLNSSHSFVKQKFTQACNALELYIEVMRSCFQSFASIILVCLTVLVFVNAGDIEVSLE
jgi:hypothetical protein